MTVCDITDYKSQEVWIISISSKAEVVSYSY